MQLTPHFSLAELQCKCGCTTPTQIVAELKKTAVFLEKVRVWLGNRSMTVNSGYRCSKHNAAVGGEPNSFHMRGYACDFTVAGLTPQQAQDYLDRKGSPVENSGLGRYGKFTHIDRRNGRARWKG